MQLYVRVYSCYKVMIIMPTRSWERENEEHVMAISIGATPKTPDIDFKEFIQDAAN